MPHGLAAYMIPRRDVYNQSAIPPRYPPLLSATARLGRCSRRPPPLNGAIPGRVKRRSTALAQVEQLAGQIGHAGSARDGERRDYITVSGGRPRWGLHESGFARKEFKALELFNLGQGPSMFATSSSSANSLSATASPSRNTQYVKAPSRSRINCGHACDPCSNQKNRARPFGHLARFVKSFRV